MSIVIACCVGLNGSTVVRSVSVLPGAYAIYATRFREAYPMCTVCHIVAADELCASKHYPIIVCVCALAWPPQARAEFKRMLTAPNSGHAQVRVRLLTCVFFCCSHSRMPAAGAPSIVSRDYAITHFLAGHVGVNSSDRAFVNTSWHRRMSRDKCNVSSRVFRARAPQFHLDANHKCMGNITPPRHRQRR